jgi:hypothetical protein
VRRSILAVVAAAACLRPADERAMLDLDVGLAEAGGVAFTVADRLAAVRAIAPGELELWAQAPALRIDADADASAEARWTITVRNCLADAQLVALTEGGAALVVTALDAPLPTVRRWQVDLAPGERAELTVAPADVELQTPWRFAYMADIQEGVDRVQDIFSRMNEDPAIRFVVAGGDLTDRGTREELERIQAELEQLWVPFYSTIGNHELFDDAELWQELYGPHNFHFAFRGVAFSLVDSGSATIDPVVYDRLDGWLDGARDDLHVFITHIPPFDPIGVREGGFRSHAEAAKLYARLVAGRTDLVLVGHVHSYYAYEIAGIPTFISGGGGAPPVERWDGVDRHYLTVDVTPGLGIGQVGLVRIDD